MTGYSAVIYQCLGGNNFLITRTATNYLELFCTQKLLNIYPLPAHSLCPQGGGGGYFLEMNFKYDFTYTLPYTAYQLITKGGGLNQSLIGEGILQPVSR